MTIPTYRGLTERSGSLLADILSDPNCIMCLPMNGRTSAEIVDACLKNRVDLSSAVNSPVFGRPISTPKSARGLNGTSQYFTLADNSTIDTGDIDFTFSVWIRFTGAVGATARGIICKMSPDREYSLDYYQGGFRFFTFDSGGNPAGQVNRTYSITTGLWYNVRVYQDSVNNVVGISINNDTATTAVLSATPVAGTSAFTVGRDVTNDYFPGDIGPIGFWKRLLTSTEASALYRGRSWGCSFNQLASVSDTIKNGLISYWDFTQIGTTANEPDLVGTNHLVPTNGPEQTTHLGVIRPEPWDFFGIELSGSQYLNFGDVDALDFGYRDPWSFLVILESRLVDGASATQSVAMKWDNSNSKGWQLYLENAGGGTLPRLHVVIGDYNTNYLDRREQVGSIVTSDTPVMLGASIDGSASVSGVSIYKNGAARNIINVADTLTLPFTTTADVEVGAGGGGLYTFDGAIGMIAFFNAAKSAADFKRWAYKGGFL